MMLTFKTPFLKLAILSSIKIYEKNHRSIPSILFHYIECHSTWRRPFGNESTVTCAFMPSCTRRDCPTQGGSAEYSFGYKTGIG